jgi:hypothetical protein
MLLFYLWVRLLEHRKKLVVCRSLEGRAQRWAIWSRSQALLLTTALLTLCVADRQATRLQLRRNGEHVLDVTFSAQSER